MVAGRIIHKWTDGERGACGIVLTVITRSRFEWAMVTCKSCLKKRNPHAVALGRKGGSVTSDEKAASSRANGKLGGRPKKKTP